MVPAVFDQTTIDISAADYTFRATGSVQKFDGYLAAYQAVKEEEEKEDEADSETRALPRVTEGEQLRLESIRPEQHFTEPPPRYTEATLVKDLEEKGIGRPSTYAAIISTIVEREYVNKDQGRFTPTLLGEKVSALLVKAFEDIFDVGFTARMEDELDEIEEGKLPWRTAVKEFWDRFEVDLEKAADAMDSYKAGIPTGQKCEKCGEGELLERISRHGFFLGCSRYPECDFIRDLAEPGSGEPAGEAKTEYCDNCGKEMAIKRGRFGTFLACTGYPIARRRGGSRAVPSAPSNRMCLSMKSAPRAANSCCGATAASASSSAARIIPSASTRDRSRSASSVRSATKENSFAAAPPRDAEKGASSTVAAAIPIAISPRHTNQLPSHVRSAARRLSSRSALSKGISALACAKIVTGKRPHRNRPQR